MPLASSEFGRQRVEWLIPGMAESVQPDIDLIQSGRLEAVQPACSLGSHRGEPAVSQHPEMLRDARLADPELLLDDGGDGAGGQFPVCEEFEDATPDGVT